MSVSPRFSSCSSDYYCPSGAASRAGNEANSHRCSALFSLIDLRPADIFRRQTAAWCGLGGELTHTLRREPFEVGYSGAWHLLIAYESAQRSDGETIIDGLPRSTLRDLSRKLVFVPAGLGFREWQEPRSLMSAIYLHLDPATALMRDEGRSRSSACAPRLFFESTALWQTALKLKGLIETDRSNGLPPPCGSARRRAVTRTPRERQTIGAPSAWRSGLFAAAGRAPVHRGAFCRRNIPLDAGIASAA